MPHSVAFHQALHCMVENVPVKGFPIYKGLIIYVVEIGVNLLSANHLHTTIFVNPL